MQDFHYAGINNAQLQAICGDTHLVVFQSPARGVYIFKAYSFSEKVLVQEKTGSLEEMMGLAVQFIKREHSLD